MLEKTVHITLALLVVIAALVVLREEPDPYQNPDSGRLTCSEPLTYGFGEIDPRFDLRTGELRDIMQEVEGLWSDPDELKLLEYKADGKVTIHLIYDERQRLVDRERELAQRIETGKMKYERAEQIYERLKSDYDSQLQSLEKEVEVLDEVIEQYHRGGGTVQAEGGDSGSATQDDPSGASDMEEKIERMKRSVTRKTTELEQTRQGVNREADRLNGIMEQNTGLIDEYNESFSEGYRFHQGVYSREGSMETINIYKFEDKHDLQLILAHETGHALGLPHVENPESVMYPALRHQNRADLALSDQDKAALRRVCGDELQETGNYQ